MAQWWDEWELRIIVLASLTGQYFLVLLAGVRKFHIPPWLRFWFRLAHIGTDALAIFALTTLFNRHKNGPRCSYAHGSRDLELLWAPILLMHLGGQVVITTYKIEDNEQSSRYILTSLSKVTVALYVFYKSWSSTDKKLLATTVLLFILVTIRSFQKALDLRSSSFNALREASSSEIAYLDTMREDVEGLENFIKKMIDFMHKRRSPDRSDPQINRPLWRRSLVLSYQQILDFPGSYSDRLQVAKSFWSRGQGSVYRSIEGALSGITSFLYTKDVGSFYFSLDKAPGLIFRRYIQMLAYATLITAICLVHTSSHKEAYSDEDTGVTLVLLYGTLLLELVYLGVQSAFKKKFSGTILQHSLIGLFAHNRRHPKLRGIARFLRCKDFLDQYFWHMDPSYSCREITELVQRHVEFGWNLYIRDVGSYRSFNDSRGEWTLARNGCSRLLEWSLKKPFDETIIIWHLATDCCFHLTDTSPDIQRARRCKEMSNYMVHLLFANPEMLMPGSRRSSLAMAYGELKDLFWGDRGTSCWDEKEFRRQLIMKGCKSEKLSNIHPVIISYAWKLFVCLAGDLVDPHDSDLKLELQGSTTASLKKKGSTTAVGFNVWEVIQGVWVEMMCFSAGRSRGYLHAETLGTGVEFLSYVWVLLIHAGMETFPDKLLKMEGQIFDFPGVDAATTFASGSEDAASTFAPKREDAATTVASKSEEAASTVNSQSKATVDIVLAV